MPSRVERHVLPAYYREVLPLYEYLRQVLPEEDLKRVFLPAGAHSDAWAQLLGGLVGVNEACLPAPVQPLPCALPDVLHALQLELLESGRPDLLTLGYRKSGHSIAHLYPNTVLTSMVVGAAWHILLARLGAEAFRALVLTTSFFFPVGSDDVYVQMWGVPLADLAPRGTKRAAGRGAHSRRRVRRRRSASQDRTDHTHHVGASRVFLPRGRLFYAQPTVLYRYGIVLGLPPSHALNMRAGVRFVDATHRARRVRVARLVQDMFPTAFGGAPAWQLRGSRGDGRRWPRCLRGVPQLAARLLARHDRLDYTAIAATCCPRAAATASNYAQATPHGRVAFFVRTVLTRLIPLELFGSMHNRREVLRSVARFVRLRRHERMSLHDVMQGIRTRDCPWLAPRGPRATAGDAHRQHALLASFLYWLYDALVIPLLRTTFFATEAAALRQRVLYFRQDVWAKLRAPAMARLRETLFERTPPGTLGAYGHLRLLPKDDAMRPIVNLRRRARGAGGRSVNATLQTALDVLTYERTQQPGLFGAAVAGSSAIYARLTQFRRTLLARYGRIPPLFAVRADVRAAFDSLDQARLVALVRRVLRRAAPAYVIQRLVSVRPGIGRMHRAVQRRAWPDAAYPGFVESAPRGARRAVLIDSVAYALADTAHVRRTIEAHVTHNLVCIDGELYRQRAGVPQGSALSTLLCNLLLADAERTYLPAGGCLMRYTDDFLFLTEDAALAQRRCTALSAGFPLHGCRTAPEKALVNFDARHADGTPVTRVPHGAPVPWCGVCIDLATLGVCPDAARAPCHVGDTLTVRGANAGDALVHLVVNAVRTRTHILYTDAALHPCGAAYVNLLDGYVAAAAKLHVYLRSMPRRAHGTYVLRAITRAIALVYPMIHTQAAAAARSVDATARADVRRDCVEWLGVFAFVQVLGTWAADAALAAALAPAVAAPQYAAARRAVGRLALVAWPAHAQRVADMVRRV